MKKKIIALMLVLGSLVYALPGGERGGAGRGGRESSGRSERSIGGRGTTVNSRAMEKKAGAGTAGRRGTVTSRKTGVVTDKKARTGAPTGKRVIVTSGKTGVTQRVTRSDVK